ncbi:serine hydrolase [Paraflavitalea sp. CAU 1676]|uniref:serine hydrolase n=1 Tax=Paraflavitalea sp. CAU 1676 TaxID=3032598 RepID=UPI0023DB4FD7|nr:serine hydrolase [Paraflavitalea sp. CAU 1676]MDF2190774.1 serine hydrolase [Paraflavitalea sp. CAU 1676]
MKRVFATCTFLLAIIFATGQQKTDPWLEQLLRQKASPALLNVLNKPDSFQYQLIYTRIDRDKNNRPQLKHFFLHVDKDRYFNPASMVKMPTAFCALEKLNEMSKAGVNKYTTMFIDSSFDKQSKVWSDTSAVSGFPSVAQYIRKIFLVSDNDAYNRLYEFVGQQTLNEKLWQKGYKDSRITRRFVSMNEEQNRHTNAIRFMEDGRLLYEQAEAYNSVPFNFSKQLLIGQGHLNRNDSLIKAPMDFTTHNNMPLEDLQQIAQSVLFPETVKPEQRFNLTPEDYQFLYRYMSELPYESKHPRYDTTEFFESYTKFFFFKAGRGRIPANIRAFNKTGWSYGFLTDVSYIVDFKNQVEFMLSGVIYTNSDGILNDNKYEYEEVGYPWFKETGQILYQYELDRPRKYKPNLKKFQLNYEDQ